LNPGMAVAMGSPPQRHRVIAPPPTARDPGFNTSRVDDQRQLDYHDRGGSRLCGVSFGVTADATHMPPVGGQLTGRETKLDMETWINSPRKRKPGWKQRRIRVPNDSSPYVKMVLCVEIHNAGCRLWLWVQRGGRLTRRRDGAHLPLPLAEACQAHGSRLDPQGSVQRFPHSRMVLGPSAAP
jgi:hypothetical protein